MYFLVEKRDKLIASDYINNRISNTSSSLQGLSILTDSGGGGGINDDADSLSNNFEFDNYNNNNNNYNNHYNQEDFNESFEEIDDYVNASFDLNYSDKMFESDNQKMRYVFFA